MDKASRVETLLEVMGAFKATVAASGSYGRSADLRPGVRLWATSLLRESVDLVGLQFHGPRGLQLAGSCERRLEEHRFQRHGHGRGQLTFCHRIPWDGLGIASAGVEQTRRAVDLVLEPVQREPVDEEGAKRIAPPADRHAGPSGTEWTRWIDHGRSMLSADPRARYAAVLPEIVLQNVTLPQPGVLGPQYRRVVVLGRNPGRGTGDAEFRLREQDRRLQLWRNEGAPGYDLVLEHWERDVENWRVWTSWVAPVLTAARLKKTEIAYLNLVKVPTMGDKAPSRQLLDLDWHWTSEQLDMLRPLVVLAGGRAVQDELTRRATLQGFELLVQNRARDQNLATRRQNAQDLGRRIRAVIDGRANPSG